jgi:hypothetical protein
MAGGHGAAGHARGGQRLLPQSSDTAREVLALRQQVAVLKRRRPRPVLNSLDRPFWTTLRRFWSHWSDTLVDHEARDGRRLALPAPVARTAPDLLGGCLRESPAGLLLTPARTRSTDTALHNAQPAGPDSVLATHNTSEARHQPAILTINPEACHVCRIDQLVTEPDEIFETLHFSSPFPEAPFCAWALSAAANPSSPKAGEKGTLSNPDSRLTDL